MTVERRVVVSGVGVVSPIGIGYPVYEAARLAGRSGVGPISLFDASGYAVQIAAEVGDYSDELLPSDPRYNRVMNRAMKLGLVAAGECLRNAGLVDEALLANTACLASVGRHDGTVQDFGEAVRRAIDPPDADSGGQRVFNRTRYLSRGVRAMHPLWLLTFIPNLAVAHIGMAFGLRGEANTYTAEGAGAIQAIGDAAASIREGLYDRALVGGCDSRIGPVSVARLHANGLLADASSAELDVSMPFDSRRHGFVVGEGAAYLLLEEADAAERRGVRALAEVVGWGGASDAYDSILAHPEGRGLANSMRRAVERSRLTPGDVDVVIAAAASLPSHDAAEARALDTVFGGRDVAVTAPASAIGRTLAASGAFAAVEAVSALATQRVPPTVNTTRPDRGSPAGLVCGPGAREQRLRTALANGYSIGGQCASAIFAEVAS